MAMMDEVAFMAATRFSRQVMVTVSSDRIDFKKSIPAGTIIELVDRVKQVGNTSMKVSVEFMWNRCMLKGVIWRYMANLLSLPLMNTKSRSR